MFSLFNLLIHNYYVIISCSSFILYNLSIFPNKIMPMFAVLCLFYLFSDFFTLCLLSMYHFSQGYFLSYFLLVLFSYMHVVKVTCHKGDIPSDVERCSVSKVSCSFSLAVNRGSDYNCSLGSYCRSPLQACTTALSLYRSQTTVENCIGGHVNVLLDYKKT